MTTQGAWQNSRGDRVKKACWFCGKAKKIRTLKTLLCDECLTAGRDREQRWAETRIPIHRIRCVWPGCETWPAPYTWVRHGGFKFCREHARRWHKGIEWALDEPPGYPDIDDGTKDA